MSKELKLWQFIVDRLRPEQDVMLIVVAESSGSSPGRAGYKMAVAAGGELCGTIGGGVMEVSLAEQAKAVLSGSGRVEIAGGLSSALNEQVHQKNSPNSSGMICSGKQTVIFKEITPQDIGSVQAVMDALTTRRLQQLTISPNRFHVGPPEGGTHHAFERRGESDFVYTEKLGPKNDLYIIGGGHCALALSELMSKMDFRISIFDDRPELNTIGKNEYADNITIIDAYERIGELIPVGAETYVVVMTLGYASDEVVIRSLFDKDFKYFGVLGSKAKMATLMKTLRNESYDPERLKRIHTPIGIPINSRTPEEIAVSIAAEIIAVKNAD